MDLVKKLVAEPGESKVENEKKRWIGLGLLFSAVIIAVTLIIYFRNNEKDDR